MLLPRTRGPVLIWSDIPSWCRLDGEPICKYSRCCQLHSRVVNFGLYSFKLLFTSRCPWIDRAFLCTLIYITITSNFLHGRKPSILPLVEMAAIEIDASYGEGGGQVLRTSLSLAAITGKTLSLRNIRAGRKKPGLAAQHLTAVTAAAAICNATLQGATLGSTFLEFVPAWPARAGGHYSFDVKTAGAVSLVLQTVLLPLAVAGSADEKTELIVKGGTHVPFSPSMSYFEEVYLPMIQTMGVQAEVRVTAWGWYPRGNGCVEVVVRGGSKIRGLQLLERGLLREVRGKAVASQLPAQFSEKMAVSADGLLRTAGILSSVERTILQRGSSGSGLFLTMVSEGGLAGFGALGRKGMEAEEVARAACEELLEFNCSSAPVDEHLADQVLLPAAVAGAESHYRVANLTLHFTTNAWVIEQFGLAKVSVDNATKIVTVQPEVIPPGGPPAPP